jgi:hypothetical protein
VPKISRHGGPSNALPITYEDLGAQVPQGIAIDYRALWRAFIADAGSASPSNASRRNLGADFVDVIDAGGGSRLWIGSDAWAGGAGTIVGGRYTQDLVPFRNWMAQETNGVLGGQLDHDGGAATTREWLDADDPGPGEPAGYYWWCNSGFRVDTGNPFSSVHVACTLLDAAALAAPDFGAVASSIVTLGLFGTYASHVNVSWGPDANFWLHSLRHDTDDDMVYGTGLVIDLSLTEFPDTLAEYQAFGTTTGRKLGRVPLAEVTTEASWEFWTGAAWSSDPADAIEMLDTAGAVAYGMTGNPIKLADGAWLNVGRASVLDPFLDVWRDEDDTDPGPTGPWRKLCRIRIPGVADGTAGTGHQASHHATIVPHIAASTAGHSVAMCTFVSVLHDTMVGISTDAWTPQFVVVPHDVTELPSPAVATGAWEGWMEIARGAARDAEAEAARGPVACPNDGEPLRRGPSGQLYCPWDGWRPD